MNYIQQESNSEKNAGCVHDTGRRSSYASEVDGPIDIEVISHLSCSPELGFAGARLSPAVYLHVPSQTACDGI